MRASRLVLVLLAGCVDGTPPGPNHVPELADVRIVPPHPAEGEVVRCAPGVATDADGDEVLFLYGWTIDGVDQGVDSGTLRAATTPGQVIRCTIIPADGRLTGEPVSREVVVEDDRPPSVRSVVVSPADPSSLDTLRVRFDADDPEGADVTTAVAWSIDGVTVGTGPSLPLADLDLRRGDVVDASVTASDGEHDAVGTAQVVVADAVPVVEAVTLTPEVPEAGRPVHCRADVTDADDDHVAVRWAWLLDGEVSPYVTGPDHPGPGIGVSTVQCVATPDDGLREGAPVASAVVPLRVNLAPSISPVTFTPNPPRTSDTIVAHASADDPEGDPVEITYRWYLNGVLHAEGPTLGPLWNSRGARVQVEAWASDGVHDSFVIRSVEVTVLNGFPSAPDVRLQEAPTTDVELRVVFVVMSRDPDADPVQYRYAWREDGLLRPDLTGATVPASETDPGETWTVEVTPDDGYGDGTPGTASTTIANRWPVVASAAVQPDPAYAGDVVRCVPGAVSDADGDAVELHATWTVDGVTVPGSDLALATPDDAAGQPVRCRLLPDDGVDVGVPVASPPVVLLAPDTDVP